MVHLGRTLLFVLGKLKLGVERLLFYTESSRKNGGSLLVSIKKICTGNIFCPMILGFFSAHLQ